MQELTFDIPYIELDFYVEMLRDAVLPENKVSALRGGMGQSGSAGGQAGQRCEENICDAGCDG